MIKEIYLIQGTPGEGYQEFFTRISGLVAALVSELEPDAMKFTITRMAPPVISVIPFSKRKMAAISVHKKDTRPVEKLRAAAGFYGAYRVTEALPIVYQKNWNDGEPTPGTCLLTLFSKKKNISYETFIDRWHNGHTPLTLRIHPVWNYVRNMVNEPIDNASVPFDGIVEEQVRKSSDLLNPFRFFGNPLIIIPRMLTVFSDTKSFIDYPGMENYLAAEYIVKS